MSHSSDTTLFYLLSARSRSCLSGLWKFIDKSCGGKAKAQKMAKSYRDKIFNKLPKARQAAAASRRKKIKQSGITGVTHVVSKSAAGKVYAYWQAACRAFGSLLKTLSR
jgi:hypothetical protein